jgi:cytochrome P450
MENLIYSRSQKLGDDLLSDLIRASSGDEAISHQELVSNCIFLFSAGHQTTRDTVGSGVLAMMRDRKQWDAFIANPSGLAAAAAEESLRYDAPVVQSWEVAFEDTEISGHPIAEGEAVFPLLGACNHDPERFMNPDNFEIGREDNVPITFSLGPHHCMGSALARMEVSIILEALATKIPSMRLASENITWRDTVVFRGPESLELIT